MNIDRNNINNCYLDINYSTSKWDYIIVTRDFIKNYLKLNYLKNEDISKVILTVSEMLENSFKYTTDGEIKIHLNKNANDNHLDLIISNTSNKNDIERVVALISEMNGYSDSLQYYLKKMRDRNVRTKKGGGLGLARINHEADAKLTASYDKNSSKITIKARLNFKNE